MRISTILINNLTIFILFVITNKSPISASMKKPNNACKTYLDYLFMKDSKNCYHNPDLFSQTTEIIQRHIGFSETYSVTTIDGYILTIFRIPRKNPKGVVILQHPVTADATVWVGQSNESLAFLLHRSGYDVWLPNHRGTFHSKKHVNLKTSDSRYWDFDFHEIGYYDYKAFVDFVKNKTGNHDGIIFVAHSMSTTSSLIYSSLRPMEAKNSVKIFIDMSPVAYLKNSKSPVRFMAYITHFLVIFNEIIGKTHLEEYDSDLVKRMRHFLMMFPFKYLISVLISSLQGWSPNEFDPALMTLSISQMPRSYPWKIFYHYVQQYLSGGRFQMFDYGPQLNKNLYGTVIPPEYPVENIITPTYLIFSEDDSIATPEDAEILYEKLSPEAKKFGRLKVSGINHVDFHYGRHRKERIFDKILDLLEKI